MVLPKSVAIKISIYTLACRELLNRLRDLHDATQVDLCIDYETCLGLFDKALHEFFDSDVRDVHQAAEVFGDQLHAQASKFRSTNKVAADIFEEVMAIVRDKAPSWNYQADIEQFHAHGCELARCFFANSPYEETQERLGRKCQLTFDYGAPSVNDRRAMLTEPFGYRAAPIVYYSSYDDYEHVVLARFTFEHDFKMYLAYPFLFFHEYTAHVYATDHGNERFNDGWMLHAASSFLKSEWNRSSNQTGLNLDQADVFHDYLYYKLDSTSRLACKLARLFDDWLSTLLPERFMQITYDLAAFQGKQGENIYWPTQFINALEHEFRTNRERLLDKIQASVDARELMTTLSPI